MVIPTKKLKSGFEMPIFGLGTWQMGGRFERDPNNNDEADIQAIKNAIDAGITHIDTAEGYADGHAEELVAKAIKEYDRKKLLIVSKVKAENLSYKDIKKSLNNSLERLETDYLDLYLIHGPSDEVPIEESMRAMNDLIDQGLVKNIGVCNFNIKRFAEAQANSHHKLVANQLHHNLIYREAQKEGLIEYCQKNDVMFIAWRPVQKGMLTTADNPLMKEMCEKYGKTPAQIAINWAMMGENMVTLSKMTNPEHLKENLGAIGWELEKEDYERLDKEFPGQQAISDAVPLR